MIKSSFRSYPVGNGDQNLLLLKDVATVMIDCNFRQGDEDEQGNSIYAVKEDVLKWLLTREKIPYVDVFVLTHGDIDHCRGFRDHFYLGNPLKYSQKDLEERRIMIDEMWFSPMIAEENTNDHETAHQKEAERRLKLHLANHPEKDLPGNRIKIIGYDNNEEYKNLNHLRYLPGDIVSVINGKKIEGFSFFIHGPFQKTIDEANGDKNGPSIVLQARFASIGRETFDCQIMFGGDADHNTWELILNQTRGHLNDVKERALDWDIFIAPHHCSWTFFNDTPQEQCPAAKISSHVILNYRKPGGFVLASSKKIEDNDDNPPHFEAKLEYLKHLELDSYFLNTATYHSEKSPSPIVFDIFDGGYSIRPKVDVAKSGRAESAADYLSTVSIKKPWLNLGLRD